MLNLKAYDKSCKVTAEGSPADIMAELSALTITVLEEIVDGYPHRDEDDKIEFRKFLYDMYEKSFCSTLHTALNDLED